MSKWFNIINDTTLNTGDLENLLSCIEQRLPHLTHRRSLGLFREQESSGTPESESNAVHVPKTLIFVWDTAKDAVMSRYSDSRRLFVRPASYRNAWMIPQVIRVRPIIEFLSPTEILAATQSDMKLSHIKREELALRLLSLHTMDFDYSDVISTAKDHSSFRNSHVLPVVEAAASIPIRASWPKNGKFRLSSAVTEKIKQSKIIMREVGLCIQRNDMLLETQKKIQLGAKQIEKSGSAELEYYNSRLFDDLTKMREVNAKRFFHMKSALDEQ